MGYKSNVANYANLNTVPVDKDTLIIFQESVWFDLSPHNRWTIKKKKLQITIV